MFQTKVITYLKSFDKTELTKLENFLESPYFFQGRKVQDCIDFIKYLNRYRPDYDHPKLAKEKVYAKLFSGECYNERKFQHLMTKTNKAIEQFIATHFRSEIFGYPPSELSNALYYRKKNLPEQFDKAHQKAALQQSKKQEKDSADYWIDYLISRELTEQNSIFNNRQNLLQLPQTLHRLDYFFIAAKLEAACILLNQIRHQLPQDSEGCLEALEIFLPLLKSGRFREEPLIDLLYQTFLLLQINATEEEYQSLKMSYGEHAMKIGVSQRQIVHGVLRNFCAEQLNSGKAAYREEIFFLYKEGLSQGVLDSAGGLLYATFKNMVSLGVAFKEYEWVEQFMEDHRYRLIGITEPESAYSLSRANLLFAKAAYDEALDCLQYNFADIYLKLAARRLEVQIYFELDSPLLDSKIQAFKVFVFRISKDRITDLHRQAYTNFIDMLKQIMHPSTDFNLARKKALVERIHTKNIVSEKIWLLNKIDLPPNE